MSYATNPALESFLLPQSYCLGAIPDERLLALQRCVNTSNSYLPETRARKNDIIKEAFEKAVASFKANLTDAEASQVFSNKGTSMRDALEVINSSRKLYETKDHKSRAKKWLRMLSSRIVYYGFVLDALAQYDSQHVALVWGAMKFLFTAILNHEELITNIAKTLAQIAAVLPRIELTGSLYQTDAIGDAIGQIYYYIIVFFEKSFKFYKKSRFSRGLAALTNPYPLEFKATVEDIERQSRLLDQLADSAMKAEIRDMHTLQCVTFLQTKAFLSMVSQPQPQERLFISKGCITKAMYEFVLPSQHDLDLGLSISLLKRRRTTTPAPGTLSLLIGMLSAWASSATSRLLTISGSFAGRNYSKDLAAELVQILQSQTLATQNVLLQPTLWALYKDSSLIPEPTHLLRQLISQLLPLVPEPNPGIGEIFSRHQSKRNIPSTSKLDIAALSLDDWVEIFALLALDCRRIFIVVDLEMVCRGLRNIEPYLAILRMLVSQSRILVKIVVLEFGRGPGIGKVESKADVYQDNKPSEGEEEGGLEMSFALRMTSKAKKKHGRGKGLLKGLRFKGMNLGK